ncbi:MAG: hypothetical protein LBN29_00090 [Mediterranea sp.]|nr:hypothetical protein [Mediterranea sp.]
MKDDARKRYRAYQKAYREEQKLLFTSTKSMLTDDIVRADRERNSLYVGLGAFRGIGFQPRLDLEGHRV